jgi:hypothetical protein
MHAGHRLLLAAASAVTAPSPPPDNNNESGATAAAAVPPVPTIYVGVTGDELLVSKKHRELIQPYETRAAAAASFLAATRPPPVVTSSTSDDDVSASSGIRVLVGPLDGSPPLAATVEEMEALVGAAGGGVFELCTGWWLSSPRPNSFPSGCVPLLLARVFLFTSTLYFIRLFCSPKTREDDSGRFHKRPFPPPFALTTLRGGDIAGDGGGGRGAQRDAGGERVRPHHARGGWAGRRRRRSRRRVGGAWDGRGGKAELDGRDFMQSSHLF